MCVKAVLKMNKVENKLIMQKRILIVDDDDSISELLSMLLEQENYIVDAASTGKEAIDKSNNNFYNLAIVDWRLPDIMGTEVLTKLKPTTPKMMKVMLTGFPSLENTIDSVNAQANAFFQKPVDVDFFLKRIKELLKQQDKMQGFTEDKMVNFIETRTKQLINKTDDTETQ